MVEVVLYGDCTGGWCVSDSFGCVAIDDEDSRAKGRKEVFYFKVKVVLEMTAASASTTSTTSTLITNPAAVAGSAMINTTS